MLYSEQLRAARALLRWEQSTVAAHARVSVETVKRLERLDGPIVAVKVATIEAIRRALEAAGIEFIDPEEGKRGPGVALKWGTVVGNSLAGKETRQRRRWRRIEGASRRRALGVLLARSPARVGQALRSRPRRLEHRDVRLS